jgi:hypothetical protein
MRLGILSDAEIYRGVFWVSHCIKMAKITDISEEHISSEQVPPKRLYIL